MPVARVPEFFARRGRVLLVSVTFDDPLNSLSGLKAYRNNVDMLAGRTLFGGLLFSDAAINLHDVRELEDGRLQTRWTLRVCFSALPWAPTARFTGISVYDLDAENKIRGQTDTGTDRPQARWLFSLVQGRRRAGFAISLGGLKT